ncbi:hypothetical protein [Gilvibacter sediminis]|uniref:hypothetical protein n=1 Tax=Gilvibacter sediminis TaxID=379071 RepID=UPI002350BCF8|nr:hypothetical protein [Gilvibacter sediminis]MDC7997428.1 hypothetical protein [Gilvibacter sediminis]
MRKLLTFALLIFFLSVQAQKEEQTDPIAQGLSTYLDARKTIHLHLNKDRYFTGESIWFSAYLFDQESGKISQEQTNLNVALLDENGAVLATTLLITENGQADGEFLISPKQTGSVLHLKAYTAEMNGYYEDDSFLATVELMGNESSVTNNEEQKALDIQILPEGGYPLVEVANNYGIKILDARGLGVRVGGIAITDTQGNTLLKDLQTNSFGMAKFVFTPRANQSYQLQFNYNGNLVEKALPEALARGIGMRIDQNYVRGDLQARVYTNEQSLPFIQNDSLKLVVHKASKSQIYFVKFENGYNELSLTIPKQKLYPGVNTITLFNSTNEPLLERLIFNSGSFKALPELISESEHRLDSTKLTLKLNAAKTEHWTQTSISVLPAETLAAQQLPNIYASSLVLPYIKGHLEQPNYYFTDPSAQKWYALDLVLLNQGWSKYKWRNIFNQKPETDYYYNGPGISLKGYLRAPEGTQAEQLLFYSKENEQVQYVPIDAKGKFEVNNIKAVRGTTFELAAMDNTGKPLDCQFFYTLSPTHLDLKSPFGIAGINPFIKYSADNDLYYTGFDPEAERLDEVVITAKKLKYEQSFRGWDARVIDNGEKSRGNLGNFIGTYGYYRKGGGMVNLTTTPKGGFVEVSPVVIINGQDYPVGFAMDAISMQDVAEIYVKRPERSVNNVLANRIHIFMVFLEEDFSLAAKEKSTAKSFTLTDKGLSPTKEYYQPLYDYKSDSFKSLGTLGWFPELLPKADGSVELQFINPEKQDVLILVNGFDAAGNPIGISKSLEIDGLD